MAEEASAGDADARGAGSVDAAGSTSRATGPASGTPARSTSIGGSDVGATGDAIGSATSDAALPAAAHAAVARELLPPELAKRLDRLRLLVRAPRRGVMHGERRGPRKGSSVELSDFRPYAEGDDPRLIDWRAYARMERLFVKLYVLEEDATLHLLLDGSQSMAWGTPSKLALAKRLAAALGYVALGRQEWVASLAFAEGASSAPRIVRGRAGLPRLLAGLAAQEAAGGTAPRRSLVQYAAAAGRPGPLVLLSDLYGDGWQDGLDALLMAGYEPTIVHILDREELQPSVRGDLDLRDDETGERLPISIDEAALGAYQEALDTWRTGLAAFCVRRGIPFVPVSTDLDVEEIVLGLLRRRGLVG